MNDYYYPSLFWGVKTFCFCPLCPSIPLSCNFVTSMEMPQNFSRLLPYEDSHITEILCRLFLKELLFSCRLCMHNSSYTLNGNAPKLCMLADKNLYIITEDELDYFEDSTSLRIHHTDRA